MGHLTVRFASIFDSGGAAAWASVIVALLAGGLGGIWRTSASVTKLRGELDDFRAESRRGRKQAKKLDHKLDMLTDRVARLEGPRRTWTPEERRDITGHE